MKQILSKLICHSNFKHLRFMSSSKILDVRQSLPHYIKQYHSTQPNVNNLVRIRMGGPEDYNDVMRFMRQYYFGYEPTSTYLGFTSSSIPSGLLDLMYLQMKKSYILVAENDEKHMIGVAICGYTTSEDIDLLHSFIEQTKNQALLHYLEFTLDLLHKPNVWDLFGVTEYFDGLYLAVDPKYRHSGIGLKLIVEEFLLAQRLNCLLYRTDASNRYSIKMAEKLHVRCIHVCRYEEYLLNGQPIFKNVKEPQTELRVYTKELSL